MTAGKTIITSVLTTIAVLLTLGAVGVLAAREAVDGLQPAIGIAGALFHRHGQHGHHGWRSEGGPCKGLGEGHIAEHATELNRWVQAELTLDSSQTAALEDVTNGLADWAGDVRPLCESPLTDAPSHVAAVAQLTETTHAAMQRFSATFSAFYASLGAEQRAKLDGWFEHEHGSRS